jgi:hypothetical protein
LKEHQNKLTLRRQPDPSSTGHNSRFQLHEGLFRFDQHTYGNDYHLYGASNGNYFTNGHAHSFGATFSHGDTIGVHFAEHIPKEGRSKIEDVYLLSFEKNGKPVGQPIHIPVPITSQTASAGDQDVSGAGSDGILVDSETTKHISRHVMSPWRPMVVTFCEDGGQGQTAVRLQNLFPPHVLD